VITWSPLPDDRPGEISSTPAYALVMRVVIAVVLLLAACGGSDLPELGETSEAAVVTSPTEVPAMEGCADVVGVEIVRDGDGSFTFHVTVASADEGWDKYADEWVVRSPDGEILGTRTLLHPHESEQPFTRSLSGVQIPAGVAEVMVAARDSVSGYCGAEVEVAVP